MVQKFTKNLKCELKTLIKGKVKCYITDDTLLVTVYAVNDIIWQATVNNISAQLVRGLDSKTMAHRVFKWYKAYIINLYFL